MQLVVVFAAAFCAAGRPASMDDVVSVAANAEAAGRIYLDAAQNLPDVEEAVANSNAKDAAALQADLAAEQAAAQAALPCGECAHDYGALCPKGWREASPGVCAAPDSYDAPCAAFAYFSMMSAADKKLFESRCEVCWPCSTAEAITPPSPNGPVFMQMATEAKAPEHPTLNVHVTESSEASRQSALTDGTLANREMLVALEHAGLESREVMAAMMESVAAQLQRLVSIAEPAVATQRSTSFLSSRVLPVDAYKIRNSLYDTEFMRSPPQAAINVISKEDVGKMGEDAKNKGMLAQTGNILKRIKLEVMAMGKP